VTWARSLRFVFVTGVVALGASACQELTSRDLSELTVRDSTSFHPESLEPYNGAVYRRFADNPEQVLLTGVLRNGTWNGEMTVYHPSGRVRYQGEMANGTQCGGWLENEDDTEVDDAFEEIKRELESLAIYPACP